MKSARPPAKSAPTSARRPEWVEEAAPPDFEAGGESDGNEEFLETMRSGKASAIDISRVAMQIASRQVAKSVAAGSLNFNDLDGLKKTLAELRQAESNYIDLEKSRRNLIETAEVESIVGACCARLVRVLNILENSIATEFSLWLADPKIAALPADERARTVRDFVARTCRDVRRQEADGVQALLKKSQTERKES